MNYAVASVIYVSQQKGKISTISGRDCYTGLKPEVDDFGNGPLTRLEEALEKVCQMRSAGIKRPISIQFLDDEYFLEDTIRLSEDAMKGLYAGINCVTGITFEPYYKKRRCKIIGGKRLKGFKEDIFNGVRCFSLYIPEVASGEWIFSDLYVDGKRAALTRFPKEGTLRCIDTEKNEGPFQTNSQWFFARKEDLAGISDVEGAIVSYYHYWVDEHSPVESYDRDTGKLTMKYKSRYLITNKYDTENTANLEYYLENIEETFCNPGEWYLKKSTGMLYYIPRSEKQTAENIVVYAPTTEKICDIKGTSENKLSNIRFRNIDFVCSKGDYASKKKNPDTGEILLFGSDSQSVSDAYGALNFSDVRDCYVGNCGFYNLGVHAVAIEQGCSNIRIEDCTIQEVGAGGIKIMGGAYGCRKEMETHNITVSGCKITDCGRRYAAGCGILACHTYSNLFCENEISELDYSGISVGWVWGYANSNTHDNVIRKNHIHHLGKGNLSDMGGIYLLGKQQGTIISENVIHDVICKHYGGWGIYTDEGSSYMQIEKNIVYRCSSGCFHQHFGCDNIVRNNVFALGGNGLVKCSVDELHTGVIFERNIFVTDGKPLFYSAFPERGYNSAVVSRHNILYDNTKTIPCLFVCDKKEITVAEGADIGFEVDSVILDPMLDTDFIPKDESPVYEVGFRKIR